MKIAKVIGNIWATRKEERLSGFKLLILQPINIIDGSVDEVPIVATDMIGAGIGETVIYVSGCSARSATGNMSNPIDASVIAIVEGSEIETECL
jgi:ethanolamine utilization protein EutN